VIRPGDSVIRPGGFGVRLLNSDAQPLDLAIRPIDCGVPPPDYAVRPSRDKSEQAKELPDSGSYFRLLQNSPQTPPWVAAYRNSGGFRVAVGPLPSAGTGQPEIRETTDAHR